MRVTHELTFSRQCPVDDALDHYELCVETTRTVKVEDILAAIEALPEKAFQEDITVALAAKLGCCVMTARHDTCVRETEFACRYADAAQQNSRVHASPVCASPFILTA